MGVLEEHAVAALMRGAFAFVQPALTDTQWLATWDAASLGTPSVMRYPALTAPGSLIEDKLKCLVGTCFEGFSDALKRLIAARRTRSDLGDHA